MSQCSLTLNFFRVPVINLPATATEYQRFMQYHCFFRLFIIIPSVLFFLSALLGIPMWLFIVDICWLLANLVIVPVVNMLSRHHIRKPLMETKNVELKDKVFEAFFHDALFVIAYFAYMLYLPLLSMLLTGFSYNLRQWFAT